MLKKSLKIIMFLLPLLLTAPQEPIAAEMDYQLYQEFLDQFTKTGKKIEGVGVVAVDYKAVSGEKNREGSLYRKLLKMLKGVNPSLLKSREERLALWINAYNIGAIKMIIDHYPVESIRSRKISWIKNPWGKKIINVGGREYALGEIEHEILLKKLKEPRAHFAIVCASVSCPDLSNKVYRPDTLLEQIGAMASSFLANDKKGLKIDRKKGVVFFSKIFKFDSDTFPNGAKDALPLISKFIGEEEAGYLASGSYSIKYFDYNWSANDLSRAR